MNSSPKLCKIVATKEQLKSIGCEHDLTDKHAYFVREFNTGYHQVKVTIQYDIETPFLQSTLNFDIPREWLVYL